MTYYRVFIFFILAALVQCSTVQGRWDEVNKNDLSAIEIFEKENSSLPDYANIAQNVATAKELIRERKEWDAIDKTSREALLQYLRSNSVTFRREALEELWQITNHKGNSQEFQEFKEIAEKCNYAGYAALAIKALAAAELKAFLEPLTIDLTPFSQNESDNAVARQAKERKKSETIQNHRQRLLGRTIAYSRAVVTDVKPEGKLLTEYGRQMHDRQLIRQKQLTSICGFDFGCIMQVALQLAAEMDTCRECWYVSSNFLIFYKIPDTEMVIIKVVPSEQTAISSKVGMESPIAGRIESIDFDEKGVPKQARITD